MRFLADESCDDLVVRSLTDSGHDVVLVRERLPGGSDDEVMKLARDEGRILLTEDKDFGRLFFASSISESGVILIRYPPAARSELGAEVASLIQESKDRLQRAFVVLKPGSVRIVARRD